MRTHKIKVYDKDGNIIEVCRQPINITKMIRWYHINERGDTYYSYWHYYRNGLMLMDLIIDNTGFKNAYLNKISINLPY
jgi:hypothetical protein